MPSYKLKEGSVQWSFFWSRAKVQIFSGGFANGKTTAAVMKGLSLAKDYPGSSGLAARATYPKLNDTLRKEFLRWCPPHWIKKRPTQDDNTLYLVNGSQIQFRYVAQKGKTREDGSTTSNLLSANYDWIVVDQVEDPELSYKDFLDLLGRLRARTPYRPEGEGDDTMPSSGPRWLILTANPAQNWFFKEVVHPYIMYKTKGIRTEKLIVDVKTQEPIIDLHEDTTYGNKDNLDADYIQTLEASYKGQMRERYLLGKWAAFEGLVYPMYDVARHLITRRQALDHLDNCLARHVQLKVVEGYDFGLVSPSCYGLSFVDDYGRVIVLDGYHEPNFDYTEQPAAIRDIRRKYVGKLRVSEKINADPAIFRRQVIAGKRNTGDTLARLYSNDGLDMRPATNNIESGIAKVSSYLNGLPKIPHLVTGEDGGPLIYFVDDLAFIDDEINSYYWKRDPFGNHIDEPQEHNDHAMDMLKYLLAWLPEPGKIVIPREALPPQWMFWHEEDIAA